MDTWLSHCRPRFILGWGVIADGRVPALPIIEHLDVSKDILRRLFTGRIPPMIHQLPLEGPEEAFDARVIPAVAFAAHAGNEAVPIEYPLVARARIMTAATDLRSNWPGPGLAKGPSSVWAN